MRTYQNKEELKAEIAKSFEKYISEFDGIPEDLKDKRVEEAAWTPAENLATRSAGQRLFLNGKRTRKMDFRYILRRIHSNGISWAGYISGLQIPMRIYHSKS